MFSVSLPKNLSLSFPLRILFLVLGTCTGAVLYHFRAPTLPTFPPVPKEEAMPSSLPVKNTLKKSRPPRRDPFRPLDHPPCRRQPHLRFLRTLLSRRPLPTPPLLSVFWAFSPSMGTAKPWYLRQPEPASWLPAKSCLAKGSSQNSRKAHCVVAASFFP